METQDQHPPLQSGEGEELLTKCIHQEAGGAPDVLVNCTVQICAAHTLQPLLGAALETKLHQSDGYLGSGPDQLGTYCPPWRCDPAGPHRCRLH